MDLRSVLLDEIALEGLDGITIPTLFIRLRQRQDISLDLGDVSVQGYVWSSVLSIIKRSPFHLQLYQLPKPRPPFILYNKYGNQKSFMFHEITHSVPLDIYSPLAPVEGEFERGSCLDYESRCNVTKKISEAIPSLENVLNDFDESLVIVASQDLRNRCLGLTSIDPVSLISDKVYCFLEKVGRMRNLGLSTVGSEGVLEMKEKNQSEKRRVKAKDVFYFKRTIVNKKLAKACPFFVNTNNISMKGQVVFLTRFYHRSVTPLENIALLASKYLEAQTDHESDILAIMSHYPEHSRKAFSHLFGTYPQNFSVFYREFEKTSTGKRTRLLDQVVKRKFVKLIKPFSIEEEEDVEEDETHGNVDEDDDDDIQDEPSGACETFYQPGVILADRTILSQVLALIETSEDGGLSLSEIGKQLSLGRLDTRSLVRILMSTNCIKSVRVDAGKYRVTRFLPLVKFEKSRQEFLAADNGLDFKPGQDTLVTAKRANCILELLDEELIVTGLVPFRKRILEMEIERGSIIDRNSIRSLVNKLASKNKLRTEKAVIETPSGQRCEQMFVISNQVDSQSPLISERISQWKFQMSGIVMSRSPVKPVKRRHVLPRDSDSVTSEALVYQPSVGRKYGAEPKLVKALTLHRFLHYLLYTLPQNDEGQKDDWRMHVKPLPVAQSSPTCLLGDVAPRLPLSTFVRIVYLTHVIPGLDDYLNDSERCNLSVSDIPLDIQRGLTHRRKYLYSLYEAIKILQLLGLVDVDEKLSESKDSVRFTLKNVISFKDKGTLVKYNLITDQDVEVFQDDLRAHCTSSCSDCTFPPQLFAHNIRNWTESSKPRVIPSLGFYSRRILSMTNDIFLVKRDQPQAKKRSSDGVTSSRKRLKKLKDDIANYDVAFDGQEAEVASKSSPSRASRSRNDDDVDVEALKLLKSRRNRSNWTEEEDSFLILARTASLLLDPRCNTSLCVSGRVVRDELHRKFHYSRDKTARAVQRRIIFLTWKDLGLKTRINEWVVELKLDDDFFGVLRPEVPKTDEMVWNQAFLSVFNKLKEKYEQPFTSNFKPSSPGRIDEVASLDDFVVKEAVIDAALVIPTFTEPQNFVDVFMYVVMNVLLSTLVLNDSQPNASQKFSKTLYNIYRHYPDALIRACVARLSKGNIMSKFKEKNGNVSKKTVSNMIVYKLSNHFNFILDTRYHIGTLINPDIDEVVCHGAPEALVLTSLAPSRVVKFRLEVPHEVLSLDEEAMKKFSDGQTSTDNQERRDLKDSSRSLMASYRFHLSQKPELSERFSADNFVLNKCKVTAELGCQVNIPVEFEESWKRLTRQLNYNESRNLKFDPATEALFTFIKSKQVIGASLEQIHSFQPKVTELELRKWEDKNIIFRLGVNTFRWIHKDHVLPWIATDFNPGKNDPKSSIQFLAKIWRKPDGTVNANIIFKLMSAITAHVLINPGISEKLLVEYFQQTAPGTQIREMIELLQAAGCLTYLQKFAGFTGWRASNDRWLETTSDCILILSQLKKRLNAE